jgi:hypothetical protein
MDIIPNLNNNGQLVAKLVARRKRKFAKAYTGVALPEASPDFPPPKTGTNGQGSIRMLVLALHEIDANTC